MKVPGNNLKHKSLTIIGQLSKLSNYLLSVDNRLSLQTDYEVSAKNGVSAFFLSVDGAKVNGTFALTKRFFDLGRRLLQQLCFFVILRYRLAGLDSTNLYNFPGSQITSSVNTFGNMGDTDDLGRNKRDYQKYLKDQFVNLKRSVGTLRSRMAYFSEGTNMKQVGQWENSGSPDTNSSISPSGKLEQLANIIYGLTNETIFTNTEIFYQISPSKGYARVDRYDQKMQYNYTPEEIYQAMQTIADRQLKRMESKYDSIRGMTGNQLHSLWFTMIDYLCKMVDFPWNRSISDNSFSILEDINGWSGNSLNQITPNVDNNNVANKPENCWNDDVKNEIDKFSFKESISTLSKEDLQKSIEKLEKNIGDEDLFGLFTSPDPTVIGLTDEVTKLEAEYTNKDVSVLPISDQIQATEDITQMKALIKRFDKLLDDRF